MWHPIPTKNSEKSSVGAAAAEPSLRYEKDTVLYVGRKETWVSEEEGIVIISSESSDKFGYSKGNGGIAGWEASTESLERQDEILGYVFGQDGATKGLGALMS